MARLGYAGISAGWISMRVKPEIGRDPPPQERYEAPYIGAHLFLDTLDNVSFPTKGYRLTAEGRTSDENIDGRGGTHVFEVNVLVPWSREKWTALLEAEIGRTDAGPDHVWNTRALRSREIFRNSCRSRLLSGPACRRNSGAPGTA